LILKSLISEYWIFLIILLFGVISCEECDDCGPSQNEPYVNLRFFNIDSLIKVQDTLIFLKDSLDRIEEKIQEGDTTLSDEKDAIENSIALYNQVEDDINEGNVRIDEVFGPNGEGPLLFRDSLTNDSLTVFRFPLDMNADESSYIIHFREEGDTNEIGFNYRRETDVAGDFVVVRIYDITETGHSFDSIKQVCNKNECISNETTFRIYF
jgi:hypothetical protein